MTPFMALIIVVWSGTAAAPNERSALIYKEVFPDKQICIVALEEHLEVAKKMYTGRFGVRVKLVFGCLPADGKDA